MIICADDYGLADDINRAIRSLVGEGRVSAVSCMAALPGCRPEDLAPLVESSGRVDVGLHVAFSTGAAGEEARNISPFLKSSLLGRVRAEAVGEEIAAQYDLFVRKAGRRPDFIDSHFHVHQLPGYKEGLLSFVRSLPSGVRPYVRNACMPLGKIIRQGVSVAKCLAISLPGARLRRALDRNGIKTNTGFAGVYDYGRWTRYGAYLQRFVKFMEPGNAILMVHPGLQESWRKAEFEGLQQVQFPDGFVERFRSSPTGIN